MNTHDLLYAFPEAFILIVFLVPLAALFLFLRRYQKRALGPLSHVVEKTSAALFWSRVFAVCLAWFCAVIALMQPMTHGKYPDEYLDAKESPGEVILRRRVHDVVFLLDTSASMEVTDMREGKSRFDEAKELAETLIGDLHGENVGVYAFNTALLTLSPPTLDYLFARTAIQGAIINEGGATGTDFALAFRLLKRELPSTRPTTVILLSDGDNTSNIPTEAIVTEAEGFNIVTVGIGSLAGGEVPGFGGVISKLDEPLLQKLGKRYYRAESEPTQMIAKAIVRRIRSQETYEDERVILSEGIAATQKDLLIYDLYFQIPLAIALLCLAFIPFFPDIWRKRS